MTKQKGKYLTIRFVIIGALGFAVDSTLTVGLTNAGSDAMISRVIAASIAIFATYVLNSKFNFRVKLTWILASKYALVQGVGILINFLVYALAVNALGQAPTSLIFAIALGSLVAMIWNYKGASSLFRTGKIVRGEEVDSKPRMQD